jgi:imidazolonepropionase-like amidohydrolase
MAIRRRTSALERGKDGTPVRFQIWGSTSRLFTVDDRVVVEGGKIAITQRGQTRSVAAPARFFVGSAYAPVTMTQELLHYWASHGRPASLPVFPIGTITKVAVPAGVTIVAGTDQAVPGHSLHREIELYVQAGFTPMEALQAATIVPARVMKQDKELGTVEAGKRADFLLVDGDPLADIRALRRIRVVVAAGRAYDPAALWRSVGFTP